MKIGRNDPCPCGSGKKYKKCCLAKDEAAARQPAQTVEAPLDMADPLVESPFAVAYLLPEKSLPETEQPALSPEDAAREELMLVFEDAELSAIPDLFRRGLADGLLTHAMASEMLAALREEGAADQCLPLLNELRQARPELYAAGAPVYALWQIDDELAAGRRERLAELAGELADVAGDNLVYFYQAANHLAYHGYLDLLAEMLARAWPAVRSSQLAGTEIAELFANQAQLLTLLAYLDRSSAPRADDPALLAALEAFAPVPAGLADQIALITGQADRPWQQGDDPEHVRVLRLSFRFLYDATRAQQVPLGRAELARESLLDYLRWRSRPGSAVDNHRKRLKRREERKARPKGQAQAAPLVSGDAALLLCPDPESLQVYISALFDVMQMRPFEAAAIMELTPAWLAFLRRQDLISDEQHQSALQSIGRLVEQADSVWESTTLDPVVGPNIRSAWQRVREA